MIANRQAEYISWVPCTITPNDPAEPDEKPAKLPALRLSLSMSITRVEFGSLLDMDSETKAKDLIGAFFNGRRLACFNIGSLSLSRMTDDMVVTLRFGRRVVKCDSPLKNVVASFANDGLSMAFKITIEPRDDDLALFFHKVGESIGFACERKQKDLTRDGV